MSVIGVAGQRLATSCYLTVKVSTVKRRTGDVKIALVAALPTSLSATALQLGPLLLSIRMEAKRRAVDTLSGADFEPGVAQNWAQFFVSEKTSEGNSLKTDGEPPRTRTWNPLIKSSILPFCTESHALGCTGRNEVSSRLRTADTPTSQRVPATFPATLRQGAPLAFPLSAWRMPARLHPPGDGSNAG